MSTGGRAAARAARLGLAALRGGGRASAWPRRALAVQSGTGAWGGAMEAAGGGAWARASRGFAGSPTAMSDGQEEKVDIIFVDKHGLEIPLTVPVGEHLLEIAHENEIELEGACEGSLACSTCHVILDQEYYDKLEEPDDDENDMLDLAFGLTETSRLGCQVITSKELAGMKVRLPKATRNMAVDGHVPKPH